MCTVYQMPSFRILIQSDEKIYNQIEHMCWKIHVSDIKWSALHAIYSILMFSITNSVKSSFKKIANPPFFRLYLSQCHYKICRYIFKLSTFKFKDHTISWQFELSPFKEISHWQILRIVNKKCFGYNTHYALSICANVQFTDPFI